MKSPLQVNPVDYHTRLTCNRSNVLAADSWLSKSVIWEFTKVSPWRWRHHPKQVNMTDAIIWGTVVDALTTAPECFNDQVAVLPGDAPKKPTSAQINAKKPSAATVEAVEWWSEWEQGSAGKTVISFEVFQQAQQAAEMLTETCKESAEIFSASDSQVVIGAKIQGLKVKGLVDLAPKGADFLADLKTTGQFSRQGFERTSASLGYHVQCGVYLALWNACFPDDQRSGFKIIWQDNSDPFEVCVTNVPSFEIEHGMATAEAAISKIKQCAESDHWPMLGEGQLIDIVRPTWASIQEEAERGGA